MNITCAEGVIENQKEYMQPIVSVDDVELALGTENTSGKNNIEYDFFIIYFVYTIILWCIHCI